MWRASVHSLKWVGRTVGLYTGRLVSCGDQVNNNTHLHALGKARQCTSERHWAQGVAHPYSWRQEQDQHTALFREVKCTQRRCTHSLAHSGTSCRSSAAHRCRQHTVHQSATRTPSVIERVQTTAHGTAKPWRSPVSFVSVRPVRVRTHRMESKRRAAERVSHW